MPLVQVKRYVHYTKEIYLENDHENLCLKL